MYGEGATLAGTLPLTPNPSPARGEGSNSIIIDIAAELFGQQNLRVPRNDALVGADAGGDVEQIIVAAQEIVGPERAALVASRAELDVDQRVALVNEQGRGGNRDHRLRLF